MNDILTAYENARFEKEAIDPAGPAAPPASPLQGADMNDAMRRVRDAIEQSIRTESRLRGQARETGEWGAAQAQTPVEGSPWLPLGAGAAAAAGGAGAAIESYLSKNSPRTAALEKAVQQVMDTEGKDFAGWVGTRLTPQTDGSTMAVPRAAPAMAQALQQQPQPLPADAGKLRRTWSGVKARLKHTSPRLSKFFQKLVGRSVDPSIVGSALGTQAAPTALAQKLTEETITGTGRQKLREAVMTHPSVTKGQGRLKRSPALRGTVKGIGAVAMMYALPYLWNKLTSDVDPKTEEAQKLMAKQVQLAQLIKAWREKQFEQLRGAQGPGDVSLVPWTQPTA